jgi:hypothetical protein
MDAGIGKAEGAQLMPPKNRAKSAVATKRNLFVTTLSRSGFNRDSPFQFTISRYLSLIAPVT